MTNYHKNKLSPKYRETIELRETLTEILGNLENNLDIAYSQSSVSLVQRSYGLFGQEVSGVLEDILAVLDSIASDTGSA